MINYIYLKWLPKNALDIIYPISVFKYGLLNIDVIKRLGDRVRRELRGSPKLPVVRTAASLAHLGLLGAVESLCLVCVDLASVPAEHLASLASCVTGLVFLNGARCDIIPVLNSIKTRELHILEWSLSSEAQYS